MLPEPRNLSPSSSKGGGRAGNPSNRKGAGWSENRTWSSFSAPGPLAGKNATVMHRSKPPLHTRAAGPPRKVDWEGLRPNIRQRVNRVVDRQHLLAVAAPHVSGEEVGLKGEQILVQRQVAMMHVGRVEVPHVSIWIQVARF